MKCTVNNVRVIRGADIGSDHHLVVVKIKLMKRPHVRHKVKEGDNNRQRLKRWKLKECGGHMHCVHILWLSFYYFL